MIIRRPLARVPVATAAVSLAVVLSLVGQRYGYHRDELYFRMLPAAWGYTDQPLLTPLLARATLLLADEPWALRLPAAGLAALSVVIIALVTREVGGGRLAQTLAAWGYAYGTFTLNFGHILMTASVDLVVWPLVVLVRPPRRAAASRTDGGGSPGSSSVSAPTTSGWWRCWSSRWSVGWC